MPAPPNRGIYKLKDLDDIYPPSRYRGEANADGQRQWVWRRTGMGEGLYDIPMMIKQLQKMNYAGFISLEDLGGQYSTHNTRNPPLLVTLG